MKPVTFKAYKEAIILHYKTQKDKDVTGILLHPTPAQIRELCRLKILNGLSNADEEVLKSFLEVKKEESLLSVLNRFNIDKFKPIISFLRSEKDTESSLRVELAAILVDFDQRPYVKFTGHVSASNVNEKVVPHFKDNHSIMPVNFGKRIGLIAITFTLLLGIVASGFMIKNILYPEKQCMQWQTDHYELVECKFEGNNFNGSSIEPVDDETVALKKVTVCDTTTFFENGKATIYYCKVNGIPEFYNHSGYHPILKKPLKPITKYIIKKYVNSCN